MSGAVSLVAGGGAKASVLILALAYGDGAVADVLALQSVTRAG